MDKFLSTFNPSGARYTPRSAPGNFGRGGAPRRGPGGPIGPRNPGPSPAALRRNPGAAIPSGPRNPGLTGGGGMASRGMAGRLRAALRRNVGARLWRSFSAPSPLPAEPTTATPRVVVGGPPRAAVATRAPGPGCWRRGGLPRLMASFRLEGPRSPAVWEAWGTSVPCRTSSTRTFGLPGASPPEARSVASMSALSAATSGSGYLVAKKKGKGCLLVDHARSCYVDPMVRVTVTGFFVSIEGHAEECERPEDNVRACAAVGALAGTCMVFDPPQAVQHRGENEDGSGTGNMRFTIQDTAHLEFLFTGLLLIEKTYPGVLFFDVPEGGPACPVFLKAQLNVSVL